ncbi:MAG: radical SAM protein [Desulfobaccales bacterium]
MSLRPAPNPAKAKPSLSTRALRLMWRNPRMAHTMLREEYRKRFGINLDRRFRDGISGPPVNFNFNLTRRCNLKCAMCEQHRHDPGPTGLPWYNPSRELPLSTWVNLLDQVSAFRPRLYLTGGEPTLYPHFAAFLTEAKRRGCLVHLQTNGTLLDRVADSLVAQGVEMVTVSLDGPLEVHDAIRGQEGAFQKTCAGIKALVAARDRQRSPGPIILINCVISKASLPTLDHMVPLARELGADILQIQHTIFNTAANVQRHNRALSPEFAAQAGLDLAPPSIPEGEYYESEITPADLPGLLDQLRKVRRLAKDRLKLLLLPNLPPDLLTPYYLDLAHPFPQVCNALWKNCRILPDGTVSPCLHMVIGNITAQPFAEIWNGPRMRGFRQIISRRLFPGCARCCSRSFT